MIDFVNNSEPDLTAENLNKMQQDIGTIVSPIEPQGAERLKGWIKKGKNLISIEGLSNTAINESTGGVDYNTTRLCSNYIYLLKGIYSISCNLSRFAYAIYDEKKQFNKFIGWNSFPNQFTIEKNCYVRIEFVKNADGSVKITKNDISTLQLEQNSEVTEYEEYIEPKTYVLNNNNIYEEFMKCENIAENWGKGLLGYKYMLNNNFLIYTGTVVANFKNGSLNLDVSELNLVTKPYSVQITPSSQLYGMRYDFDNSSSTNLRIEIFNNGQIYPYNGNIRFSTTIYGETK